MLNRVKQELPSASDIAEADDIELQEFMENAVRSTDHLITQLDNQMHSPGHLLEHPLHELLGLDKELRSIRGLLKVETVKKAQLEERIEGEKHELFEIRDNQNTTMAFEKTSEIGSKE